MCIIIDTVMHSDKHRRQQVIIDQISRKTISSQEDLKASLLTAGVDVTQATLSRDLKELGVVKIVTDNGFYKYTLSGPADRIRILSCEVSGNILVLKTYNGLAPAVAYEVDSMDIPQILGTVAGENTLFIVIADDADKEKTRSELWERLTESKS